MAETVKNVLPKMQLLSESFAMDLVAEKILEVKRTTGLTPAQMADRIMVSEKTIKNAIGCDNKISFPTLFNMLTLCPTMLDPLLHHFDRRSVPMGARCDTDALDAVTALTHKLVTKQQDPRDVDSAIATAIEALVSLQNERASA